jgi:hypothetical protein
VNIWMRIVLIFGAFAACSACSEHNNTNSVSECENLVMTVCDRAVVCLEQAGIVLKSKVNSTYSDCIDVALSAVPCDNASAVSNSYFRCLSDIEEIPCTTWDMPISEIFQLALPSSCMNAIISD